MMPTRLLILVLLNLVTAAHANVAIFIKNTGDEAVWVAEGQTDPYAVRGIAVKGWVKVEPGDKTLVASMHDYSGLIGLVFAKRGGMVRYSLEESTNPGAGEIRDFFVKPNGNFTLRYRWDQTNRVSALNVMVKPSVYFEYITGRGFIEQVIQIPSSSLDSIVPFPGWKLGIDPNLPPNEGPLSPEEVFTPDEEVVRAAAKQIKKQYSGIGLNERTGRFSVLNFRDGRKFWEGTTLLVHLNGSSHEVRFHKIDFAGYTLKYGAAEVTFDVTSKFVSRKTVVAPGPSPMPNKLPASSPTQPEVENPANTDVFSQASNSAAALKTIGIAIKKGRFEPLSASEILSGEEMREGLIGAISTFKMGDALEARPIRAIAFFEAGAQSNTATVHLVVKNQTYGPFSYSDALNKASEIVDAYRRAYPELIK